MTPAGDGSFVALNTLPDLSHFGDLGIVVMSLAEKLKELADAVNSSPKETAVQRDAYKVEEAAERLSTSKETIYKLVKRGLLETSLGLGDMRIPHRAIENYLNATSSKSCYRKKRPVETAKKRP